MTTKIEINEISLDSISTRHGEQLEGFLQRCSNTSIFHTLHWNKLIMKESEQKCRTLVALKGNEPVGLFSFFEGMDNGSRVLMSPASRYYSIYGCPVALAGHEDSILSLLSEAEHKMRGAYYCLVSPPGYSRKVLEEAGYMAKEGLTSIIDLKKTEDELFGYIEKRSQKAIRSAIKHGVTVSVGDERDVDEFCRIYAELYSQINESTDRKLYILPERFLKEVYRSLSSHNNAFILVGKVGEKVANSSIQFCYNRTVYAWLLGTRREFREYKVDTLLYWTLIKWGRDHGFGYLDLCGIDIPSMAQFKRSFGGSDIPFYYASKKASGYKLRRLAYHLSHPRSLVAKLAQQTHKNKLGSVFRKQQRGC
jgi:hypothetical protein